MRVMRWWGWPLVVFSGCLIGGFISGCAFDAPDKTIVTAANCARYPQCGRDLKGVTVANMEDDGGLWWAGRHYYSAPDGRWYDVDAMWSASTDDLVAQNRLSLWSHPLTEEEIMGVVSR